MPRLSVKKILTIAAIIIALTHLPQIVQAIQPVYQWFCKSLSIIREFPRGMQAAIAISLILLVFVTIAKFYLNKDRF